MNLISRHVGRILADYLSRKVGGYLPFAVISEEALRATLVPGDILLVEGNQHVSVAIKYLTQSTWSHAVMYVGDALAPEDAGPDAPRFIEADLRNGVVGRPFSHYAGLNSRICRAPGLTPEHRGRVVNFLVERLGMTYDLKNVVDLLRYMLPKPAVPPRWRRRMLALGSGDPTRAICSTLIAQAFQTVGYPILPIVVRPGHRPRMRRRHHTLYTPRDFDLSPYFQVVKPTLERGFDYRHIQWEDNPDYQEAAPEPEREAPEGAVIPG
ncbi:MAG: lipo-like protein [Nitrospirae bacterium]|nr:lipo-like protein [Nitrospirota bacterium]